MKLRAKLTLLIEGLVVILVVVSGIITTLREKESLENELRKRGLALAADLAKFSTRPLLDNDLPTLRRFVNHSMEQEYVRYVFLLDPQGKVVMHSNLDEVGKIYEDSSNVAAMQSEDPGFLKSLFPKNGEHYYDIFSPIRVADARLGTVRLGYSYMAVEKEIAGARQQIVILGFVTILAGGFVAYLLATFISAPIKQITDATRKVAQGDLVARLTIERTDEIGELALSFNRMTDDLQRTTISRDYVDNIIGSMNDTLVVLDKNALIVSVNNTACALLGCRPDELVGSSINKILPSEEIDFFTDHFNRFLSGRKVVNLELNYRTMAGLKVPMLFSAGLLHNKEGAIDGVVCIAHDVTERKQAEESLRQSESELRYLSSQLLTAQEKERRRLSVELHDELGQSLMVLKLKVRAIQRMWARDKDPLKRECDEIIGYINEVSENVRRLSRDLSPSLLEDLGLTIAMRRLVETSCVHSGIDYSLDMTELDNLFSGSERITVYRILQECLTNIAKYAQATSLAVILREEDGCFYFCVVDNGQGFDLPAILKADPSKKGLGLSAMNERVRMLGGKLDIVSHKGSGTTISFRVPLKPAGERA
ncbi:MAG: PAS domain S-box protein [Pseudomonadota bacterium]